VCFWLHLILKLNPIDKETTMVEKKTNPGLPAWGTPDANAAAAGKPAAVAPAASGENPYTQWYEVKKGDTLWKIAKEHYGDGNLYPEIFKANQDVLSDPDKIQVGQKLRIP
jgi:nucleoid-associated protein YgaU